MRWVLALLLSLLVSPPLAARDCRCPTSSRQFTGAALEAPFYVFDGGSPGVGLGQYGSPVAIAAVPEGYRTLVVVADSGNHRVHVMTDLGFFLDYLGGEGSAPGDLKAPAGLAMSPEGNLWVSDAGNHRLQKLRLVRDSVFDVIGQPLAVAGRHGAGAGGLSNPAGLATDEEGNVYVADAGNHRIQKLGPDGRFLGRWGSRGTEAGQFETPMAVAVGAEGAVFVVDSGNHRVQVFDAAGRFLRQWGSRGSGPGQMEAPHGLAVDDGGNLYVADSGNDRILKFDPRGGLLATAGCSGTGPGEFRRPVALALDPDRYLYVVDAGNHRIQKLGPP